MASAYQCDSCGKYYSKNETMISFEDRQKPAVCYRVKLATAYGPTDRSFDLCDDCLKKILDILNIEPVKEEI